MADWTDQILEQMDADARQYRFPMLNNAYLRGAGARLTVFRAAGEGLWVFEQLGVMDNRDFVNAVSAYGNRLEKPGLQRAVDLAGALPGEELLNEEGTLDLDPRKFGLVVRGRERRFEPTAEDYVRARVDLNGNVPDGARILRWLAVEIPAELFLGDRELLEVCSRADAGLTRFLQLVDWHHPDTGDDELPSGNDCFRSLAAALAAGDPARYQCPAGELNTHWSFWESIYQEL